MAPGDTIHHEQGQLGITQTQHPPMDLILESQKQFITKDSGERQSFTSGAVRDTQKGKGRYDLLSPLALRRLSQLYERGAEKYKPRNWESGMPISRYVDSGIRHFFNYLEGERTEDHPAAVMWNSAGIIHTEEMIKRGLMPKEYNDMPNYIRNIDEEIKKQNNS